MHTSPITAEFLWINHRAALGGKSAVSGAPLPEYLSECNAGVQGSHWGMACAVARALRMSGVDVADPPRPEKVTDEEAERIQRSLDVKLVG